MTLEQAKNKLVKYGQEHVLKYYEELSAKEQEALLKQILAADMSALSSSQNKEELNPRGVITPLAAMQLEEIQSNQEQYTAIGLEAIRQGKMGAVMLAGGMGTRLGSDAPKGMYNLGITKELYIFECQIKNLLDVVRQADAWVHLFIMTSDKNYEETVNFLKEKAFFGYKEEYIHFFIQELALCSDFKGKILLEEKGKMADSPNGNGGWFISMKNTGMLDVVHKEGIEWLNIFAVDNVLQRIADPCLLGATLQKNCVSGAKVVKKNAPREGVGVLCLEDGKPSIVEYYELTDEMVEAKDENGEPAYNFGVILNYIFRLEELEATQASMPLHIVEKKIPCLDENGEFMQPEKPNGFKYETLVLDMVHQMPNCLPFEVEREREFAPIKNMTGVDSVETARILLEKNGVVL